ncbi:MAG: hypothetical protein NVSMB46_08720 [Candidatus Saccharimonadales bacterium]
MKQLNEQAYIDVWLILFIVSLILFLAATGFGAWSFISRQDYKNNSDKKVVAAVSVAQQQTASAKDNEFIQKEKYPLKSYQGPATFGSVGISYPKTWSAFITETNAGESSVDGYFHPNYVPGLQSGTAFALKVNVINQSYDQVMQGFTGLVTSGKVSVSAFRASKVPSVLGARIEGSINQGQNDSMVIVPVRDKTLEIMTESHEFSNDFNTIILPSLTFNP